MGRSSKVMTPRNVDLPMHVLKTNNSSSIAMTGHLLGSSTDSETSTKKPENPRKKCLCLTLWILVLLLLCAGVFVIANFLIPNFPENIGEKYHIVFDEHRNNSAYENKCLEKTGVSLEQKVMLTPLIVVGKLRNDLTKLKVKKILKRSSGNSGSLSKTLEYSEKLDLEQNSACHLGQAREERIFFLSQWNAKISQKHRDHSNDDDDSQVWVPRFLAIPASDKLTQVIESLFGEKNAELVSPGKKCENCKYGGQCLTRITSQIKENFCSCDNVCKDVSPKDAENVTPVCGSDHVTYENRCALKKAACVKQQNITILTEKLCIDSELCGVQGCPNFGVCTLGAHGKFECSCSPCPQNVNKEPICGMDGNEYKSKCELEFKSCKQQKHIPVKHYGPCESCENKVCARNEECRENSNGRVECVCKKCSDDGTDSPVKICGTDGITYFSLCHLEQASCIQAQDIQPYHHGPCDPCKGVNCKFGGSCGNGKCICDERKCPESYEPVCASNGKTYLNYCQLELDNCRRQQEADFTALEVVESDICLEKRPDCLTTFCSCPEGVGGLSCERCMPKFWAYTSFRCKECGCNILGSESLACDPQTGACRCKPGFVGDKCNICPDGTLANVTNCLRGSTRYSQPIPCGDTQCNFGASCSDTQQCLCEIDCRNPMYYREAVCGSDGNTYRSECQLRQYSCRLQKEVSITMFGPCKDAPTSIYGSDLNPRQLGVLADEKVSTSAFGLIGDVCTKNEHCLSENSVCSDKFRCECDNDHFLDKSSKICRKLATSGSKSLCEPNPCNGRGTCEEHDGIFSCYCRDGFTGTLCQHDISQIGNIKVPSFTGNSSISVVTSNVISRMEVNLKIRILGDDGLILYSHGSKENDFLSLAIINRHIEFRFDLGSGPVHLRSLSQLVPGKWHQIVAKRYHQDGLLEVDNSSDRVMDSAKGSLKTLNVDEHSWIGGVELSLRKIAQERSGVNGGLLGCIKDFQINKYNINLQSDQDPMVYERHNIIDCEANPCVRVPCGENGVCSVDNHGFKCQCRPDFTGRTCQRKRNECHPNPCQNNGDCQLDKTTSAFVCSCKDGFTGRLCENKSEEDIWRRFRKSSDLVEKQKISFGMKTNLTNGAIFDINLNIQGDEATMELRVLSKGKLFLEITDEKMNLILQEEIDVDVADGQWHRVGLSYQNQRLKINVDSHSQQLKGIWKKLEFQPGVPKIGNHANNRLCIRNYILRSKKGNRFQKSKPIDICK